MRKPVAGFLTVFCPSMGLLASDANHQFALCTVILDHAVSVGDIVKVEGFHPQRRHGLVCSRATYTPSGATPRICSAISPVSITTTSNCAACLFLALNLSRHDVSFAFNNWQFVNRWQNPHKHNDNSYRYQQWMLSKHEAKMHCLSLKEFYYERYLYYFYLCHVVYYI